MIEALFALLGGLATFVVDCFVLSKKDQNEFAIKLIETLQNEIKRLEEKLMNIEAKYEKQYDQLQEEYNQLKKDYTDLNVKYKALKRSGTNTQKTTKDSTNDISNFIRL